MNRRMFLASAAAGGLGAAETNSRLLPPSDQPDEHGFRLMCYNPIPPIDQTMYRLRIKGLVEKTISLSRSELRWRNRVHA